jgi:NitT/TauT family transport system substrate-binding protein
MTPTPLGSLASIALCMAFVLALDSAQPASAETIVVGRIGAGSTAHWPLYVGQEKGLFKARGLELDLIVTPSNTAMQQQLAAGSLDIGISAGSPDPVRAAEKGAPIVIVRIDCLASPYALVSKANIATPADLKGKTISLDGPKGITRAYFDRVMAPTGLKAGDFDLIFQGATPARFAALQSGSADAAMLTSPFNFHAEAQGFKTLVLVNDVVKDIPFSVSGANKSWVLAHKDAARKFQDAFNEAVAWWYDPKNRDEAIAIMLRNSSQKEPDIVKTYDFFQQLAFFNRTDAVSRKQMQSIIDVLIGFGDVQRPMDIERLVVPEVTKVMD